MAKITPIFSVVDYKRNIAPILILLRFLLIIGLGLLAYFLLKETFFAAGVSIFFLFMISFIKITNLNIKYENWNVERLNFFGFLRTKYSNVNNPNIKIELSQKTDSDYSADSDIFFLDILGLILLFFYSERVLKIEDGSKKIRVNLNEYEFWLMLRISRNSNTLVNTSQIPNQGR
jgi:hypothetical protein